MPMISLAIDANEANVANRVGSNVYAFHILTELAKLISHDPQVKATVLLAQPPLSDLPKENDSWHYRVVTPAKFWTQFALPLYLYQHKTKFDLFYTPGHYAPRWCAIPYVSSVMDLAFLHFPDQFKTSDLIQLKNWTNYSVRHAQKIVTISEFSKQEIINAYQRGQDDIVVAYPSSSFPDENTFSQTKNSLKKLKINKPYFLFIGTLQPRKNLITLIKAYELFCEEQKKIKSAKPVPVLVLAGKIGWLAQPILDSINNSTVKEQIILTGFVPDSIKVSLYQNALATILVGLYEGFGLPALESMQFQTLPIVSNNSSLPEVVDQAGILVNPHKSANISQGLMKAYNLSALNQAQFNKRMKEQVAKFSWQKSAQKIYQLLLNTASHNG